MVIPGTRERLIRAASNAIWQNSYSSVSVDDICKVADVRKGSFYHFFKSKSELAVAVMEQRYDDSKHKFDAAFSCVNTPIERLEKLIDITCQSQENALRTYGHVCGCPFSSLGSEMASQDDLIQKTAQKLLQRYRLYYQSTLRDMIAEGLLPKNTNVEHKAEQVANYMCGELTMARVQNSLKNLEKNELKATLLRLLGINA